MQELITFIVRLLAFFLFFNLFGKSFYVKAYHLSFIKMVEANNLNI